MKPQVWERNGELLHGGNPRRSSGYKDVVIKGVLLDMGYYAWHVAADGESSDRPPPPGAAAARVFVHLMQIVHCNHAPRVILFGPLNYGPNWEKISPGFFDAPGSSRLIFPGMRELLDLNDVAASRPNVAVAFASLEGFNSVRAFSNELGKEMLSLHNACVRETLSTCNGYECKVGAGGRGGVGGGRAAGGGGG